MTSVLFEEWLISVYRQVKLKKRKIVFFIDNCTTHMEMPALEQVKVIFLPANTTSVLQPLKCHYTKEVVRYIDRCMVELNNDRYDISLFHAICFAKKSVFSCYIQYSC